MMSRILVVEDEAHLAEGLRFNLEAEGYQVAVAETGEAALDLLAPPAGSPAPSGQFDVMVLDVMLPGKDGFTVMSEVRQAGQYIPTLMLTARGHPDDVLRGFAAGTDDYLPKPFDLPILVARIRGLLRRKEWSQQPPGAAAAKPPGDAYSFDGKTVDFSLLELQVHGKAYPLTLMEAHVL